MKMILVIGILSVSLAIVSPCYCEIVLKSVADGTITAPGGVPIPLPAQCGEEIRTCGQHWVGHTCLDRARGMAEFDLSSLPPGPFSQVVLRMPDSGGWSLGISWTEGVGYIGDGVISVEDWGRGAVSLFEIGREYGMGDTTEQDVTDFVNANLGETFIGFRLQAADSMCWDSFGHALYLRFTEPVSVPGLTLTNNGFCLGASFPNPFNPVCTIRYGIPSPSRVSLQVFDVTGSCVCTLVDAWREPGVYKEVWDGRANDGNALPSGVYFYRLKAGDFVVTRKMVLLR